MPVESDGRYDVSVILTKAVDYGIVQLSIDGTKMGKPIDLFNRGVIRTDAIPLGTMELTKGDHVLGVEIVDESDRTEDMQVMYCMSSSMDRWGGEGR